MSRYDRYGRYDATDEQWEGLAQVVPLRGRNELLTAAGFAPVYRESNLAAPELTPNVARPSGSVVKAT